MELEQRARGHSRRVETFDHSAGWTRQPELQRVRRYALAHLNEKIDLQLAARIARLNKSTFCTRFRRSIGIGFPEWLARVRVGKAVELLTRQDIPVASVSKTLGFGTLRTFQRTFKKIAGTTAGTCRAEAHPTPPGAPPPSRDPEEG